MKSRSEDSTNSVHAPYDDPAQLDLIAALEEGRRRRDRGQQTAEHGTDVQWKLAFDEVLSRWARSGEVFTVNEIIDEVGPPLAGTPQVYGTLMSAAAKRGLIAKTGTVRQSPKASRNGGWVFEWRGVSS